MSRGERAPLPTGGLQGSRARSYGSLVRSSSPSPVSPRRIEHRVQPGDTLQGLSLKYGVSMEDIKRANRLYTNDSIFLKEYLSIPVPNTSNGLYLPEDESPDTLVNSHQNGKLASSNHDNKLNSTEEGTPELSPMDFLKRMDSAICQSKEAAVKSCQAGERSFSYLEAAGASRTPERRVTRSQSATSAPRMHQQAVLGGVPLTTTRGSKKLREREDDIFEL